jgi:hypothetical protein
LRSIAGPAIGLNWSAAGPALLELAPAEHLLRDYEFGQSEQDRHNGWRYFLEETDLVPGMSADEATKLRQARLERRESES